MKVNNFDKEYGKKLLNKENIVGIGIGKKIRRGKKTNKDCITILVSKKKPLSALSSKDIVPKKIEGLQTDVIEVSIIRALYAKNSPKYISIKSKGRTGRWRPSIGGISIGHEDVTVGTFGCVVYKNKRPYILSNNHVLANSNDAQINDPILQPGTYDGGKKDDKIAILEKYVEIRFEQEEPVCKIALFSLRLLNWLNLILKPSYKWGLTKKSSTVNQVDAAIAKPLSPDLIKEDILEIGKIKGLTTPSIGLEVQKSGRTTGYSKSNIEVLDATIRVDYSSGKSAVFEGQIITGPMSQGGDSGSVVLDMNNKLVGLLFAGSDQITILNPIQDVFKLLGISLRE